MPTDHRAGKTLRLANTRRGDPATLLPALNAAGHATREAILSAHNPPTVPGQSQSLSDTPDQGLSRGAIAGRIGPPTPTPRAAAVVRELRPGLSTGPTGRSDAGTRARRAIGSENRIASGQPFDPTDPRWLLALQTAHSIEGGRAAVLPPEARARLVALGTRLGLRPFDANLVIAIVQDGARSGEGALDVGARSRLGMVRRRSRPQASAVAICLRIAAAALLAIGLAATAIGWIERW